MRTPTREIRVLVCGSRTWNDPEPIRLFLAGLKAEHPDARLCVLHSEQGAGLYGGVAADALGLPASPFEPPLMSAINALKTADIVLIFSDESMLQGIPRILLREAEGSGMRVYVISHSSD